MDTDMIVYGQLNNRTTSKIYDQDGQLSAEGCDDSGASAVGFLPNGGRTPPINKWVCPQ